MSTTARAPRRSLSKRLFADSSIAAKIGLCLALLVLVAAGLTGLSVQRMNSLNHGSEQLYDDTSVPMTAIVAIQAQFAGDRVRNAEVPSLTGADLTNLITEQGGRFRDTTALLDKYQPKALISAERIGPGKDGILHSATGIPFYDPSSPSASGVIDISAVVTEATKRGILTIGIGDHGNEIGFGAIHDTVVKTMPRGEFLGTTTACDIVLPVMMSNWGCYGIEAALAYLLKKPEIIHTPAQEERMLRHCLDAGGLEAMMCTTDFLVDGLDGETSMAVMQILGNIVRKNLEAPTTGVAH